MAIYYGRLRFALQDATPSEAQAVLDAVIAAASELGAIVDEAEVENRDGELIAPPAEPV
jgi:hypothetical protein